MKSKRTIKNAKIDKILSEKDANSASYSLRLIESFAHEFSKIAQDDIDKSLQFIKEYRQKIRVEIDANPSLIQTLSKKWQDNNKNVKSDADNPVSKTKKNKNIRNEEDIEESGSQGGSSGDEIFITLWLLVGIESLTAEAQEALKIMIDNHHAYKQFNTKVLDNLPKEFNQKNKMGSLGIKINE